MSLRQITIGSAAMSSVGLLRILTQLLVLPILARYLSPADYGIIAISMPFVLFAMAFSDAGIGASLIRNTNRDIKEWSTSFWFTILLGFALSLAIILIGYIMSVFMSEPEFFSIIAALSIIIILQSISTVPGASLQQSHKFNIIAGIEITAMFLSLIATLLSAIYGWGAWALVFQQLTHYIVKIILTLYYAKFRPHFIFQISSIKSHLIFGRDLLGNNIVSFIQQSTRNMIMGKVLGIPLVGIYSMSSLFSTLPQRIVSGPLQLVLYPRISSIRDNKNHARAIFIFVSRIIAIIVAPIIGMIAIAHTPIFTILLSDKWSHAGYIFMLLSPAATLQTITALRTTVAMAYGRTNIIFRQSIEMCIIYLLALTMSVNFGLETVVITATVISLLYIPRSLMQILPLIDLSIISYAKAIIIPIMATITSIITYLAITMNFDFSNWAEFSIAFCLGMITLGTSIIMQLSKIKYELAYIQENVTFPSNNSDLSENS